MRKPTPRGLERHPLENALPLTRRRWLSGCCALAAAGCAGPPPSTRVPTSADAPVAGAEPTHDASAPGAAFADEVLTDLEAELGGRLGAFALDSGSGRTLAYRADERFAMCSTFKWALAAAVLTAADRGEIELGRCVAYGPSDLLDYAPVTRAHLSSGAMSVEDLCAAVVTVSDNTAANLLLRLIDGPAGLTRYFRGLGDEVTRLDRYEPDLNGNLAGDVRDTTSPRAMVQSMRECLVGEALAAPSRERLLGWLVASRTGLARLRAGVPPGFRAGDKTGSGQNGAINDVAIVWPPGRPAILLGVYASGGSAPLERFNAAHARVARRVLEAFAVEAG